MRNVTYYGVSWVSLLVAIWVELEGDAGGIKGLFRGEARDARGCAAYSHDQDRYSVEKLSANGL